MSAQRPTALAVLVAVGGLWLASAGVCMRAEQPTEPAWVQRLARWVKATAQHEPGTGDGEARLFATWSRRDLRSLLADVVALRDLLGRTNAERGKPDATLAFPYAGRDFTRSEIQELLGLSDDEAAAADVNGLLKRAAILHMDVPMFVPSDERAVLGRPAALRLRDGQIDGYEYSASAQWTFARELLDALRPNPALDPAVRLWYKASAAHLVLNVQPVDAEPLLERARALFPSDASFLYYSGCVQESYGAPSIQAGARLSPLPAGRAVAIGTPASHLRQAEAFFAKALQANPRMTEARVRLGRVLGQLGRHAEAVEHLRGAATETGDPIVRYYAALFLGNEEEALAHFDAARGWYENAVTLYSEAQSPRLALSHLAWARGDRAGAMKAVEGLRAASDASERDDPWFIYYPAAGRDAEALLGDLHAAVARR